MLQQHLKVGAVAFGLLLAALVVTLYNTGSDRLYVRRPAGNVVFRGPNKEDLSALAGILATASLPDNNTVIFSNVNAAWAEPGSLLPLFLRGFELASTSSSGGEELDLMAHLVLLTFDEQSQGRCLESHPQGLCYQLHTEGVADVGARKAYMSKDYVSMMWRRIEFLNTVLQLGYSFIFSDADILWLRNPFPFLLPEKDFQISCDRFNGDVNSFQNSPNGGYTYAHSNNRTIEFFKFWYESWKTYPHKHDQDVFIEIRNSQRMKDIGVRVGFLDTQHFVSFCSHWTFDMHKAVTIHSNCCNGLPNKVRNLKAILADWEQFRSNESSPRSWTHPSGCTFANI